MAKASTDRKTLKSTRRSLSMAIAKARRFQKRTFAGKTFSVSSSVLIAQARRERTGKTIVMRRS